MPRCPSCSRRVEALYQLPPAVITPDLIQELDTGDGGTELRTCVDCLNGLMTAGKARG